MTDEDALNQRITELETKYHDSLAVVKDLEGREGTNKMLRHQVAPTPSTKNITQQLKTAKRPAAFGGAAACRADSIPGGSLFQANDITKTAQPGKLEAEVCSRHPCCKNSTSSTRKPKEELLKLKPQTVVLKQVKSPLREEEPAQQEIKECAYDQSENRTRSSRIRFRR